jgi:hypothetical protein
MLSCYKHIQILAISSSNFCREISRPIGDATLAALLTKASASFFTEGDSIELLVSEKHSVKQDRSLSDAVYLYFRLSGGTWWKTSRAIEWSK